MSQDRFPLARSIDTVRAVPQSAEAQALGRTMAANVQAQLARSFNDQVRAQLDEQPSGRPRKPPRPACGVRAVSRRRLPSGEWVEAGRV